jgi:large subunit ribosomal protein L13
MKTYSPKPDHIERSWYVVDASDMVLGRLSSEVAALLRGKHKPIFAPHMDCGDHVIVINADKVTLTGGKEQKKLAHRHSGYPGGITSTRYGDLMADRPVFVVEKAVRGMLPKNRLGRAMIKKLHVVAGPEHPHAAQQPVPYTLGEPPAWEGLPEPKVRAPREATSETAPEPTAPAEKPAAKKPGAKATTTKSTARKPAAKKSTAKKSTAKTTSKKPAAKKAAKAETPAETDTE